MSQIPDQKWTQQTITCHFFWGPKILQKTSQISQPIPAALSTAGIIIARWKGRFIPHRAVVADRRSSGSAVRCVSSHWLPRGRCRDRISQWSQHKGDYILTDNHLEPYFFQSFHSPHLEPSKNLHTKNLLASKVLTVRPFRCTRFLLWEPRQPTVRYALTIFFSQHNLLSFQFSRSVSAMFASSNRHWLKTKKTVWDWTFWKKSTSTRMSQRKFNTRRHT